jgi:hypothetical protein
MPSTYTTNGGIELIATGEQSGTWGDTTNDNLQIIDRLTNGVGAISLTGTTHTLTTSDGALSDGQYAVLVFGGTPSGTNTVTISPNTGQHLYFVKNGSGQSVVLSQGSGSTVTVADGKSAIVYADGAGAGAAVVDVTNTFNFQPLDAELTAIAALATTDGNFIVGNGSTWVAESGSTARTSLGLGSISTQAANNVSISGGSITGITDLAVADGGTGVSTIPTNGQLLIGNGTGYTVATLTAGTGASISNTAGAITISATGTGGTVTSVGITAGSLIDVTNSPITTSGDITIDVDLSELTDMTQTMVGTDEFVVLDSSAQRRKAANEIGLSIFNNDAGFSTTTGTVTSVSGTGTTNGLTLTGTVTSTGNLTLGGTLAISNADWSGTDLAVVNGGTGASDAATARTNLGLAIGTNVQAYDPDLSAIAGLAATDGNFIVGNGSTWVAESGATARTSLGLGTGDSPTFAGVTSGQVDITATGDLRLQDTTGGEYVALQAPGTISASYTLTLPAADGTNGQVLQTNGSGALSFANVGGGGSLIYITTINPSNAASVYFSNTYITSTYDEYEIHGNASVTSNYWQLQAQIDTGVSPTTVSSGYEFSAVHFRSATPTYLGSGGSSWSFNTAANTLYGLCTFVVRLRDIGSDGKSFQSIIVGNGGGSAWLLSGITFYGSTGNITGSFRLYGVKKT